MMKRTKQALSPLMVQFVCPKCGTQLAWALPTAVISCPKCGKWVTDDNRQKGCDVYLPIDGDQTVLFK